MQSLLLLCQPPPLNGAIVVFVVSSFLGPLFPRCRPTHLLSDHLRFYVSHSPPAHTRSILCAIGGPGGRCNGFLPRSGRSVGLDPDYTIGERGEDISRPGSFLPPGHTHTATVILNLPTTAIGLRLLSLFPRFITPLPSFSFSLSPGIKEKGEAPLKL